MADRWRTPLTERLKKAYSNGEHSDLTVTCGNDTHLVHKVTVCTGCDFFAGALRFTVGKEAKDNIIDLPDDDPAAVKALLAYLYTTEYEPTLMNRKGRVGRDEAAITYNFPHTCVEGCSGKDLGGRDVWKLCDHHRCSTLTCGEKCVEFTCNECGDSDQLLLHAKVYNIADKYAVAKLQALSLAKFRCACSYYWDCETFAIAARYIFTTTPDYDDKLRKIVRDTIVGHIALLHEPEIEEMLSDIPGLAKDVLLEMGKTLGW